MTQVEKTPSASADWYARACRVIPGGVNSPVRAFRAVEAEPIFVQSGSGAKILTVDGRQLYDLCASWGPLILGHAPEVVLNALATSMQRGCTFGISAPGEVRLAETICRLVPDIEQLRLVNSGTEATMTALRLARGITGRHRILKFAGCYHGHSDQLLVAAGSGLLTSGIASSAGVSPQCAAETLVLPYNDEEVLRQVMSEQGHQIAAIIVEPLAGNMGLVPARPSFLQALREVCDQSGTLLIFDEVISGFRLACTTYGSLCGVSADLICLGKIIGGGLPLAALGGARRYMSQLAPEGSVYQAGTLSGNPLAVAAGQATLDALEADPPYERIADQAQRCVEALRRVAEYRGIDLYCAQQGSMFTVFFTAQRVEDLQTAQGACTQRYAAFFRAACAAGVYLPPSQFEVAFTNAALVDSDLEAIIAGLSQALEQAGAV